MCVGRPARRREGGFTATMASIEFFEALHRTFEAERDTLNRLDAAIGDGDHGTTMLRGLQAARTAPEGARAKAFMRHSGGASGTLFGLVLHELEKHLDGNGLGLALGLSRAADRVRELGEVEVGDKTMIDALMPAVTTLDRGGSAADAAKAAAEGRDATTAMAARSGRARYVENAGVGQVDPGATSVHLILQALADCGAAP